MKKKTSPPRKHPTSRRSRAKPKSEISRPEVEVLGPDEDEPDEDETDEAEPSPESSDNELDSSLPVVAPSHDLVSEPLDTEEGIAQRDLVAKYLEDIRKYPLLDPEEEFALATKLKNEGDMEAARRLVSANLRLVVKIAFEYRSYYSNLLDLIQEGNVGLMKAVSKFDPTKGARLGYYASWWIRSYILKYLLDNFRLVKIGKTQAQKKLFYHLMREKERLEAQGLLAGPKLLAEKLNVREKDVIDMEQRLSGRGAEMSLDAPVNRSDGSSASHLDLLADAHETADEALARRQLLRLLEAKLPEFQKQLNEKELKVLQARLLAEEPKTLQEVADLYGLTRERARQIEAKVITKLREFLRPEIGA